MNGLSLAMHLQEETEGSTGEKQLISIVYLIGLFLWGAPAGPADELPRLDDRLLQAL